MFGWRGRIGVILGSPNAVVEAETCKMLPEGVSAHFTRVPYAGTGTAEAGRKMLESIGSCARLLAGSAEDSLGANVIGLAHGSGSSLSSSGANLDVRAMIAKATGVPAVTASSAVLDALRKLGARSIGLGLPLSQPSMTSTVKGFLEKNGVVVKKVADLGLKTHHAVSSQPPESAYRLMKQVFSDDIDAVVINNANLRTIEVIEAFERDYGKPVVTANQALLWACLRVIGVNDSPRHGKLFEM